MDPTDYEKMYTKKYEYYANRGKKEPSWVWFVATAIVVGLAFLITPDSVETATTDTVFVDGFEEITPLTCHTDTNPLNGITGFSMDVKTWKQVFKVDYPSTPGYLTKVGSSLTRRTVEDRFISIPFTASESKSLAWEQAQGGNIGPAGPVYVTLSPCPGDFRLPDRGSEDSFLSPACRKFEQASTMVWGFGSTFNRCGVELNQQLYLNVLFYDPSNLEAGTTCKGGDIRCDVSFQ